MDNRADFLGYLDALKKIFLGIVAIIACFWIGSFVYGFAKGKMDKARFTKESARRLVAFTLTEMETSESLHFDPSPYALSESNYSLWPYHEQGAGEKKLFVSRPLAVEGKVMVLDRDTWAAAVREIKVWQQSPENPDFISLHASNPRLYLKMMEFLWQFSACKAWQKNGSYRAFAMKDLRDGCWTLYTWDEKGEYLIGADAGTDAPEAETLARFYRAVETSLGRNFPKEIPMRRVIVPSRDNG